MVMSLSNQDSKRKVKLVWITNNRIITPKDKKVIPQKKVIIINLKIKSENDNTLTKNSNEEFSYNVQNDKFTNTRIIY